MRSLLPFLPLLFLPTPALAQSILPATDGTGTLVLPDGATYTITGGTLSGDGANLFHSFEQFGLTATEVANFLADPAVQNILSRVIGGNASVIDGLLQVSGSPANLYLLNPAGILFGPNSALNLEGSFTATTASGLGFGENWLNVIGETDYAALVGDPTAFYFGENSGALVNTGNLAVDIGERLTLAGGSVINLGTLSAPGGQIMVLAVPGENLIRLQPVGSLLSLELAIAPEEIRPGQSLPFSPLDIPSLLRGGEPEVATDIVVNADGRVSLTSASAPENNPLHLLTLSGTALVSGLLDVAGKTGGTVQILGERVAVISGRIDASGMQGGGTVQIGGDYQGGGTLPTSDRTYVDANSTINASALERGDGGQVILWAEEGTRFDGTITAQGGLFSGNGGFVEVSGRETLSFNGQVDVSAPNGEAGTLLLDPTSIVISAFDASSPEAIAGLPDILAGELPINMVINSALLESQVGNVVLQATEDIFISPLTSLNFVPGGTITFTADADGNGTGAFTMLDTTQSINARGNAVNNGRDISISGTSVTVGAIDTGLNAIGSTTNGGNITLTATSGAVSTGLLDTSIDNGLGNAGRITLNATGAITNAGAVAFGVNGSGGDISLTTTTVGSITTGGLTTLSNTTVAGSRAGNITVTTAEGSIVTGAIDSRASNAGPGGAVTVRTNFGAVTIGSIASSSGLGAAGTVDLRAFGGEVRVNGLIDANSSFGTPGAVFLNNEAGGIATADIVAGSVQAISISATPFGLGNITATNGIELTNAGGAITAGNLTATNLDAAVGSGGALNLGNVTAGQVVRLSTGAGSPLSTGNLTAGDQVSAVTEAGGSIATQSISVGAGIFSDSIVLVADEIDFLAGADSVQGPNGLFIAPATGGQPIALGGAGDTGPGTLDLTATDLAALANGFSQITIGDFLGTPPASLRLNGDVTFRDPVRLSAGTSFDPGGVIDTTGGTLSGVDNASLTLQASRIVAGSMTTAGQPITLDGTNGGGSGPVAINGPITSNGGAITITGATPTGNGVAITNPGSLNSGGGAIEVTGTSTDGVDGRGILISGPTIGSSIPILASQGGVITLRGNSANSSGVEIAFSPINSGGGDITIEGTSNNTGGTGQGIYLLSPLFSEGGQIRLTGQGSFAGFTSFATVSPPNPTVAGIVDAGTGSVEIVADNLFITRPVLGGGSLVIRPQEPALPLTLGGTTAIASTFLNADEIAQLGNGFTSRTIGQPGNTGAITLGNFILNSPLTLSGGVLTGPNQNTTWQIDTDGTLVLGGFGALLRLTNPSEIIGGDDAINTVLGSSGDDTFTLLGPRDGLLGGVRFRNINAFDGGTGLDILAGTSADEFYTITGSTSGVAQDISFINVEALATNGGQDLVDLAPGVPLSLAITGGDGTLTLQSTGGIILDANVTTPGNLTLIAAGGDIAQSGGRVTAAGATVLGATGNISLGGSNDFSTVDVTTAQAILLNDTTNLQLNTLEFTGGLDVTAGGDLTATTNLLAGGAPPVGPGLSADTLAGVRLTSGNNLTTADITAPGAPIALRAGGTITSGNLNSSSENGGPVVLQAGDRIQVNTINAQGTSQGGSITALTGRTFQALGTFFDQAEVAASLSTLGLTQGGRITLAYGGFTFTVGDPSLNGTAGAITTGDVNLLPGQDLPFVGSRIVGRGQFGEVQFISLGVTPEVEEPPAEDPGGSIDVILEADSDAGDGGDGTPVALSSTGELLQDEGFDLVEETLASEFSDYFGGSIKPARRVTLAQARATLRTIQAQTGEVPAFVYVRFNRNVTNQKASQGALELLLITAEGEPILERVLSADPQTVLRAQELLRRQLTNPNLTNNTAYLAPAQQLYGWIIGPIQEQLEAAGVTNIGFIMDAGLRTLPLAALHSGDRFLVEDYSVGLIPSVGLIDPTYVDLNRQNSPLLVAGASQFINQPPLLAARAEMEAIQAFWSGDKVSETNFTVRAVQRARRQAQIIHLATHAQFLRGTPDQSYIQFFDSRLRLNDVAELGWYDPPVDLVTLSACQTAMGNLEAELGFAGFALQAGARSALASLWRINDEATTGLMVLFYQQLDQQAIKAEALRQAQLALIRGEAYIEDGVIQWGGGSLPLPAELAVSGQQELHHPFYWAAFTMVGSPW